MLKNLYDTDCTTFSPQGKLFQVEYAQEAVKLGSICLGLRSQDFAVICTLKRAQNELSGYQEKLFKVDTNIGMAMSGLTADARILCKYMRNECLNYKHIFESDHPIQRLINKVAEKSQIKTQVYSKRPYGVGLLVIGYDNNGPHLFETSPSGDFYEFEAQAIGARSQSARTYFENNLEKFKACDLDQLILHGLSALKCSIQEQNEFNNKSIEVAIVGKNLNFKSLDSQNLDMYFQKLNNVHIYKFQFQPQNQMEIE